MILVAGDGAAPSKEFLQERWAELRQQSPGAPDLTAAIRDASTRPWRPRTCRC